MSYILEALKKLEQKRQRGETPQLSSFQSEIEQPKKKTVWPYFLVAALLLNAGAVVWWTGPWRPDKRVTPGHPMGVSQKAPASRVATPAPPSVENRGQSRSSDTNVRLQTEGLSRSSGPVAKQVPDLPAPAVEKPAATRPASPGPQMPKESRAAADSRVVSLNELPPAVRNGMPELRISVHSYSTEPGSRFVRINDTTLREKDVLPPGLKVEEIAPDGILFSYQGYRFHVGVNEGR